MAELKSLNLGNGAAQEKTRQNFDEHENEPKLVTGTNLFRQSSRS